MYRRNTDHSIVYTAEDLILFSASPFASWMERLTLENPDHGIAPDPVGTSAGNNTPPVRPGAVARGPGVASLGWRDFVEVDRSAGRRTTRWPRNPGDAPTPGDDHVVLIEPHMDESQRLADTLDAMRSGAAFIVNGQLAVGELSDSVDLLMRSGGSSELGTYHYMPCDTRPEVVSHTGFRLSFRADLLEVLQGRLPGQMLVIRDNASVMPLETQRHIYHYRAVKQRFLAAQSGFRKHRMPDPSESASFGRWSECANAVLRQRAIARLIQEAVARVDDSAVQQPAGPRPVAAPMPVARPEAVKPAPKDTAAPGSAAAVQRRSLIDLDSPGPRRTRVSSAEHPPPASANYDSDDVYGGLRPCTFDSTLMTSAGGDW